MNIRFYNIYAFISFFPIWIFRGNLQIIDLAALLTLFLLLPYLFHLKLLNFLIKKEYTFITYIWIAIISFYSIDQNLGLWIFSGTVTKIFNAGNPYYNSVLFSMLSISLLILLMLILKKNGIRIIFSFISVLFLFNCLDFTKNLSNFPPININSNNKVDKLINDQKKLIIIFDEMSGFNSNDNNVENGVSTNNFIKQAFIKNRFDVYTNAYSLFFSTDKVMASSLNFITTSKDYEKIDINKSKNYINKSNNYFIVNDLEKNKLFDLEKHQNIIVHQSMFLNFCKHKKVIRCVQFNPFDKNLMFIEGFKNTLITKYVSVFKNNGSIFSNYVWRLSREFRLSDSILDPEGEKASFEFILQQIFSSINQNNSNLIFAHILVPHIPYGFDNKCNYDGNKSIDYNRISLNEKRFRHNLEKYCLIKYLNKFFEKLKKNNIYNNLEIILFSDHDSRISNDSNNNVIFAHKKSNSAGSKIITEKISINEILHNLINNVN